MNNNEGPIVEFPGISVIETVITFLIVPTVIFVVISVLAYAMSKPRSAKTSSITTIE
jgi:large-conductance mechanosensitive channel